MEISPSARALVRLGVILLVVCAASSLWFFFASQIPSSAWRADVVPGPVGQLRDAAGFLALLMFALAWLMPFAEKKSSAKVPVIVLHVGIAVTLLAMAYGATTGMYGMQIDDPRMDSRWLLLTRMVGEITLIGSLVVLFCRVVIGLRTRAT